MGVHPNQHKSSTAKPPRDAQDVTRNERPKTIFLNEVSRMHRKQSSELFEQCQNAIARNKKLRETTESLIRDSRDKAS
jgi:hypothetical protein